MALCIAKALCMMSPASAQTIDKTLPEVTVSAAGARDDGGTASVGGFAEAPVLQIPASVSVITQEQLRDLGIRQTAEAARLDASVNDAYNAIGYAEQFSIRGFALDNESSYRKDGLPISSDAQIPLENKERIEILKGLAGLQAGIATPGGIVNFVTKRSTATPLRSVLIEARERGTLYGAMDLGGRSDDQRFGYRINAAGESLRSYVSGADGKRQFVSGAFDWRLAPQALLLLDLDYQRKSQLSVPGFQLIGGASLPTGISGRTMLNNQPWSRPVVTGSGNIGLRFEYQLNADWSTTFALNRHRFKRDDFAAFPYGCAAEGLFPGFCANGDYDVYDYQSGNESRILLAGQATIHGKFVTASMGHELTAGVMSYRRRDEFGDCVYGTVDCAGSVANGTSNIYTPVAVPASAIATGPIRLRRRGVENSLFVQDILALSPRLKLHAGARYAQTERDQFDPAGVRNARYDKSHLLPNVALVFNPRRNWTVYGSYAQGLEHGGTAPLFTTNVNQILDPGKSKQLELGVKTAFAPGWFMSAALFRIVRPFEYTDASFTYVRNGEAVHDGIEFAARGRITRALSASLSLTALDARQRGTGVAAFDGKRVTNVPEFRSVAYLDYAVPRVTGLALNGSWQYAGSKVFSPDNSVSVPSYHLFNLGARHATRMAGAPVTLRFNIDNVFDKFYWRDVTQSLGGYLFPGAPRTFRLSAQFDF
jgi:iron complex outermembrane receptor protein